MEYEIRALRPEEHPRHRELMAQAFSAGRVVTPLEEGQTPDVEGKYGVFDGTELRAAYTLCDFRIHWGNGQIVPMGGLAGVATFAETRGRGYVGALLRHALETMRERGQAVSALYPFSWAFYRRYGWEWVGEERRVTVPLREIPSFPEGKNVREVRAEDARDRLKPLYAAYARRYRGAFDRPDSRWEGKLKHHEGRTTYVYLHQPPSGTPDGYLLWRFGSGDKPGHVVEMAANTPEAYRGLLSMLHYFGTQHDKASGIFPADDPLRAYLMHWDLETRVQPVYMGRVVDVAAAVRALKPPERMANGAVTVAVTDEHAPWNTGTWRIACEDGQASCAPATGSADLSGDIQAFSQAFWGTPSLVWLRRVGRVAATDPAALAWLDSLFAGPPIWTRDGF